MLMQEPSLACIRFYNMSSLFVFPSQAPTYGGGNYASASLYFFETGTLTPAVTYQDGNLAVAHTHPVVADGGGVFPPIWLSPTTVYRVQLRDLAGTTVKDVDPYPVAFVSAVFSAPAITLGDGVGIQQLYLNGDTTGVDIVFQNSGVNRILLRCSGAESGSNSGSDLVLSARDDAGASLGNIVTFDRSSQIADFAQAPTIAGVAIPAYESGTYTGTATGLTTSPTGTIRYERVGNLVTICISLGNFTGTSNATSFTITGALPASCTPTRGQKFALPYGALTNNGAAVSDGGVTVGSSSTVITLEKDGTPAGFTNSGTKAVATTISFTYILT